MSKEQAGLFDFDPDNVGDEIVCGVDEAGRGPLAGPVFAAAVILDPSRPIEGLRDSKKLTADRRHELGILIRENALAWAVAKCSEAEIDRLNILHASMLAMKRAVNALQTIPTLALIDGNRCPVMKIRSIAIVEGDDKVHAISAASILAKTARDAALVKLHRKYPQYGFDQHKGYGTELHLEMLRLHGPCPVHRRSYAPIRELLEMGTVPTGLSPDFSTPSTKVGGQSRRDSPLEAIQVAFPE